MMVRVTADKDEDRAPAVLIAVPDEYVDDLVAAGIVGELPTLRHSAVDAVLTIGTSILTVVTLLRAPAAVQALATWLRDRTSRDGVAIEIRANRRGTKIEVRGGSIPADALAAFITAAIEDTDASRAAQPGAAQSEEASTTRSVAVPAPRSGGRPRVFICYAHDSEEHKAQVRRLGTFLAQNGMDVTMDAWSEDERQDWQQWATRSIRNADFVLVIASPKCRKVGDGDSAADEHRGLRSELNILRELYHSEPDVWPKRILPVVLKGRSVSEIPLFLQPRTADHYVVEDFTITGAEDLLRHLTGQPRHVPPPPGEAPTLPPVP